MDTLVENAPPSWTYNFSELIKIAERFEEKVNASAKDEADYIAKISRKLISLKASSPNSAPKSLPLSSSSPNEVSSAPSEVSSAPGAEERAASIDWQKLHYQRVQRIRSTYFSKLTLMYHHVVCKLQQSDSASQKRTATDLEKCQFVKRLLEGIFRHLNVSKSQITPDFKERLDRVEKHISTILRTNNVSPQQGQGPHYADVHSIHQAVPSQSRVSHEKLSEKQHTLPMMSLQSPHLTEQIPQQNKMNLQEKSNSDEAKPGKSMQQVAKESSSSQKHEYQLCQIKGVKRKHSSENLPISSAGNAVQRQTNGAQQSDESFLISTPAIPPSPLLKDCDNLNEISCNPTGISDEPTSAIQRLVKVLSSMPSKSLNESISEIRKVVCLSDRSSAPFQGPKDVISSNLVVDLSVDLQAGYSNSGDFLPRERKMRRCSYAMPLDTAAIYARTTDSLKPMTDADKSDLNSSTSQIKPMVEEKCALLEEIKKVNKLLIDTEVVINEEDTIPSVAAGAAERGEGLIVKCLFRAIAVSLNLMSHFASNPGSIIRPLWLLVPTSYPMCSPILLDEMPSKFSSDPDDLSMKAKSKLSFSLRNLIHPWSVGDIAMSWEKCAREAICDYAQQHGGGTFSSKYGGWETCPNVG